MAHDVNAANKRSSSPALIALAWLVVIVPTAWGLEHTVENAIKIFTRPTTPATAPVTPGPTR